MVTLKKELVTSSAAASDWDLGNKALYNICQEHPNHKSKAEIIAKVWLIGRTYAAAIERRKITGNDNFSGDNFYLEKVAPDIISSNIDEWLGTLKSLKEISVETLDTILLVHLQVTTLFSKISGLEKRSLASKYLHFHYPDLFFIYDSRAVSAVSHLSNITGRVGRSKYEADNEYRKFCEKCIKVRDYVKENFDTYLTARGLDNLLLKVEATS